MLLKIIPFKNNYKLNLDLNFFETGYNRPMVFNSFAYSITNDIGLLAFAISGVYKGIKRNLDILGVTVLGFATALGGGITRDILANKPPAAFSGYNDIGFTFAGIVIAVISYKLTKKDISKSIMIKISDAIGLAAFTVTGALVAFQAKFNLAGIILLSFSTAVGGGLISDLFTNKTPMVLKEDFYATCAIIGALWFYASTRLALSWNIVIYTTFLVVLAVRVMAIFMKWNLPKI